MILLIMIGLLLLMPTSAISQPPSPTPTYAVEKKSSGFDSKKHNTQITTTIVASMADKPSSIPPSEEHENKWSPEWWLVYITGLLVLATGGLMIYTAKLWRSTKILSEEAKDTSIRQAEEMQQSLAITKESIDLARQEFISAHRPRLIIRNVTLKPYHDLSRVPIEDGKPIMIEWSIVNVGETPAEIITSNATAFLDVHPFEARTGYSKERNTMGNTKFIPGDASTHCFTANDIVFPNYGSFNQRIVQRERVIYFIGFIEYKDAIGTVRRTAFCRGYNPTTERFVVVNDPDYEYVD